jgi:hypothetical protein
MKTAKSYLQLVSYLKEDTAGANMTVPKTSTTSKDKIAKPITQAKKTVKICLL